MRPDAHTLVAAYAAGALEESERADVQSHLAHCDVCRDDLRGFRETLAVLAEASAEAPPARMREAVLARARLTPQLPPLPPEAAGPTPTGHPGPAGEPVGPGGGGPGSGEPVAGEPVGPPAPRGRRTRRGDADAAAPGRGRSTTTLFALAASALTVVALAAGAWAISSADRLGEVQAQQESVQRVLAAGDGETVSGTPQLADGVQGDDVTVLASRSADAALLLPAGLPAAPEGSTWQAWTVAGEDAVSAGVFDVSDGDPVALTGGVSGVDAVAVTLEPAGGSEAPTTDPVLVVPLV